MLSNVTFFGWKLGSMATIFLLSMICCYLPWVIRRKFSRHSGLIVSYFNCLAGGVVLGALLMHMIPEMFDSHNHDCHSHNHLPTGCHHGHADHSHSPIALNGSTAPKKGSCCDNHKSTLPELPKVSTFEPEIQAAKGKPESHQEVDTDNQEHKHENGEGSLKGHDHDHKHHAKNQEAPENITENPAATTEKVESANTVNSHSEHEHDFGYGSLFAGISFLFLFAVDRLFMGGHSHGHDHGSQTHKHHHHSHEMSEKGISSPVTPNSCSSEEPEIGNCDGCHHAGPANGCHSDGISERSTGVQAFVFVVALSMHSFMEGLGLSTKNSADHLTSFLISLFAHKWLEAFALGVNVMNGCFSPFVSFVLIFFYAFLTPFGGILSMLLEEITMKGPYANFTVQALNGLAVGSFLFVSCIEMIPPEFEKASKHNGYKFLVLCTGFAFIAVVSLLHVH